MRRDVFICMKIVNSDVDADGYFSLDAHCLLLLGVQNWIAWIHRSVWPDECGTVALPAANKRTGGKKIKKFLCFSAFLHGIMFENCKDHRASANTGSVVLEAWTQNEKANGTQQKPCLEPLSSVLQGGSWGVDFILPCTMETVIYTTKPF